MAFSLHFLLLLGCVTVVQLTLYCHFSCCLLLELLVGNIELLEDKIKSYAGKRNTYFGQCIFDLSQHKCCKKCLFVLKSVISACLGFAMATGVALLATAVSIIYLSDI